MWEGEYLPFGRIYQETGTAENNIRFPGQYYDQETGLHYNYFRYYDPQTGRYLRADPIGLVSLNSSYVFVANNPGIFVDPYGLVDWKTVGIGTGYAFLGVVSILTGAVLAATPTVLGQIVGVAGVLGGSSSPSFGVSQIIAGFADEKMPYMGVKEAIIENTTSGLTRDSLLSANDLLDMMPDIASGRMKLDPSKFSQALDIVQYGISIGKSAIQIERDLEKAGVFEQSDCKEKQDRRNI